MNLDIQKASAAARAYAAGQMGCAAEVFSQEGTFFVTNKDEEAPFIKLIAMGKSVVVSASPELLPMVRGWMQGKSREEIFEFPLVFGQTIHFIPDQKTFSAKPLVSGYSYHGLEGEDIKQLAGLQGCPNSLVFDGEGHTGTRMVFYAMKDGEVIGLAGAGQEAEGLWEMGVDVEPAYQNQGLASVLVSHLAEKIMGRGIVPFYSASVTNIGSQSVAHRCGLMPCWVSTYSNVLRDGYAYQGLLGPVCGNGDAGDA